MDHSLPVRVSESARGAAHDLNRVGDRQLSLSGHALPQRLAFDVRHDVEEEFADAARIEERQNVRMLKRRRHPNLDQEPLGAEYRAERGLQNLERDFAVVSEILRAKDVRHPPATDLLLETISVTERRVESSDWVHRRLVVNPYRSELDAPQPAHALRNRLERRDGFVLEIELLDADLF